MRIIDTNCKRCKGTGVLYSHGAFDESELYSCDCGLEYNSIKDLKKIKNIIKAKIKHLKKHSKNTIKGFISTYKGKINDKRP